jgi:LacI family transcriptional regulator
LIDALSHPDCRYADNDRVVIDHYQSGYAAARYLLDLGHTRIATIYPRLNTTGGRLKRAGIRAALADAGITIPGAFEVGGGYGRQAGFTAMMDLAVTGVRPTAVISCASLLTIGALRAAQELSLRIPDDISLIAIDDYDLFDLVSPPITVIDRR